MSLMGKNNFDTALFPDPDLSNPVGATPEALVARPVLRRRPRSKRKSVRSSLVMHNVVVDSHRTTVRLEPVIWDALQGIARQEAVTMHELVSDINHSRTASSLSSGIRAYVVTYLAAGLRESLSARFAQDH